MATKSFRPPDPTSELLKARRAADIGFRLIGVGLLLLVPMALLPLLLALNKLLGDPRWAGFLGVAQGDLFGAASKCFFSGPCLSASWKVASSHYLPVTLLSPSLPLLALLSGVVLYLRGARARPTKLPGAAQFVQDYSRYLNGISYLGVKDGKLLRYPDDLRFRHTLIIGSTGAGKTSRIIRPMLAFTAEEGRSAVVIDLKYPEGLLDIIPLFEEAGHEVIVLLPYDERSPRLPLLKGADDPIVAQRIAEVLFPFEERETATTYYRNIEREFAFRLIHLEASKGRGSLGRIRYLCQQGPEALKEHIQKEAGDALKYLGFFFDMSKGRQAEMVAGLVGKLSIFGDPLVDRFTSFGENEVDLRKMAHKPTLVYFGIPQDRVSEAGGQILLQLFKRYLDWVILEESKERGHLKVPVEIYLDEFTNLGFLPRMSDVLSTMRSRRVAYILALQSIEQGLERYKKEELESIMANCNTWIILPQGLHDTNAKRFSEAIGEATVYMEGESVTSPHPLDWSNPWPKRGENRRMVSLPLLAPEEMRKMPIGKGLLRFTQDDPMIVDLPRLDEVLREGGPKPLKEVALKVKRIEDKLKSLREVSPGLVSEYIIAPYLSPAKAEEEEARTEAVTVASAKERLFSWIRESIERGASMQVHRDPIRTERITKISITPPAGLVPQMAEEWEKARWVKLEKSRSVVSLVGQALEEFLSQNGDLVTCADYISRVRDWVEANAFRLQGHPRYNPNEEAIGKWEGEMCVIPAEVLAMMGIDPKKAPIARPTRWRGSRGFVAVPLQLSRALSFGQELDKEVEA